MGISHSSLARSVQFVQLKDSYDIFTDVNIVFTYNSSNYLMKLLQRNKILKAFHKIFTVLETDVFIYY